MFVGAETDHSINGLTSTHLSLNIDKQMNQKEGHRQPVESSQILQGIPFDHMTNIRPQGTDESEEPIPRNKTSFSSINLATRTATRKFSKPEPLWSMLPRVNMVSVPAATASLMPMFTNQTLPFPPAPMDGRPINFGIVLPGVYRSSYPKVEDYGFLQDLKLKTVVTLVKKDEVDHDLDSFVTTNGIRQVVFNMKGTKKESIPSNTMSSILQLVLDQRNYPLLLHCNHGKHRTGCVVAAVRKVSGWDIERVIDEYKTYATPKIRECDVDYITSFQSIALEPISIRALDYDTARFSPVQIRSFFRTLLFTTFVATIWVLSGSQIAATSERMMN